MNVPTQPASQKFSHGIVYALIAAGGVAAGAIGAELVKPKPPSKADIEAVAEIRRIVEVASQSGKGLSFAECQAIASAAAPSSSIKDSPVCPANFETRLRELQDENKALKQQLALVQTGTTGVADTQWKSAKSSGLNFSFKDVVIHPSPDRPGRFSTSAMIRISNANNEPIEIAINAIGPWPTLLVEGITMGSDNRTISMPFFMNGSLADCARQRQLPFTTLQPGDSFTTSIGFLGDAAPTSMDKAKNATLVGSILVRTAQSTACTNITFPSVEVRTSLVR